MKSALSLVAIVLLLNSLSAQTQPSQEKVEKQGSLALSTPQKKTIAPKTTHVWSLALQKDQYVAVEVMEKSIDVAVRIVTPQGTLKAKFNNPMEVWETVRATWIAETAGTWQVEIVPSQTSLPGIYEIKWVARRRPNKSDWQTVEADSLYNLAQGYHEQGKYEEADSLCRLSLVLREKIFGPDHLLVAKTLRHLGALYQAQSKYSEAEPFLKRSLRIYEKAFGSNHREVANTLNNLVLLPPQKPSISPV